MSLATAALLLTVMSNVPSLPYLTQIDKLIFHAFFIQLVTGIETMVLNIAARCGPQPEDELSYQEFQDTLRYIDVGFGLLMCIATMLPFFFSLLPQMIRFKRTLRNGPRSSSGLQIPCTPNGKHGKVCRSVDVSENANMFPAHAAKQAALRLRAAKTPKPSRALL
eukprot:Transcript_27739.p2 GENE.Transcript_27739~~Transcript_27739.p2  ORF type:complete len:165 (-),score=18.80 Transcript_27739:167-661(-)